VLGVGVKNIDQKKNKYEGLPGSTRGAKKERAELGVREFLTRMVK